ncbi:Smr/MutS family protein [Flavobacterium sp.]|uniref:Smr/MutS family protein n=1 Tax=Flavobacterium sp. TaxID=239 RepID=UPI003528EE5A
MKNSFTIGDRVAVLDEAIEGKIIAIKNNEITIETTDFLQMTYFVNELIKLQNTNELHNVFSSKSYSEVIREKTTQKNKKTIQFKTSKKDEFVLEVDLHIEKLVPSTKGLENFDMLNIQLDEVKRKLEFCIKNRIPKMVLIHGVGEGVLKSEIEFLLGRYDNIIFQDASYRKYGLGATEVYFKQNKN